MDIDKALRLLELPREVGLHPEDGKPITAGLGRYGPFVLHEGTYANLESIDEVFEVGLNRAVTVLAEKRAGGGKGGRATASALKDLGAHPEDGQPIRILSGRFGPYIKHGSTNANVPRGKEPTEISLEEAVSLLAERAAKGGGGKKKPVKKAAAPKAKAEKVPAAAAAKKKPAVKKKAPAKSAKAKAAAE
jgi:DNA topoisomerase-1